MQLHMLSGLFHLSSEQCCSGGVFSLTLKTSWKSIARVCVTEGKTGLNAEKKQNNLLVENVTRLELGMTQK